MMWAGFSQIGKTTLVSLNGKTKSRRLAVNEKYNMLPYGPLMAGVNWSKFSFFFSKII